MQLLTKWVEKRGFFSLFINTQKWHTHTKMLRYAHSNFCLSHTQNPYSQVIHTHVDNANIVQRVKTCYKIKINYRDSDTWFSCLTRWWSNRHSSIEPLLHSHTSTLREQKRLYCMTTVAVLECKRGSIAAKSSSFTSLISQSFVRKPHNTLCINTLSFIA